MRSRYLIAVPMAAGLALLVSLPSTADEAPSKEKIDKFVEQLGSDEFAERERATKELAAIGAPALEALRKAAKSYDAEVRKRASDLLPKIEAEAENARILASKRIHLICKDAPLDEAMADFQKKSGYSIHLHDPDGKLKERKITLDTGEATFWHALALICDKAELTEASMEDLMRASQRPGGDLGAQPDFIRLGQVFVPGMLGINGQIILKDGKAKKLPTDDHSAVRIRALSKSDLFGNAPQGEIILALEATPEPKLQWQIFQSVRIDKAVDDRDQKLAQVIPQVEGVVGGGGPVPALQMQLQMERMRKRAFPMMGGGLSQPILVQLKKGAKDAQSLKELKGVITAQLLTEAQPLITADNLAEAAGKTFTGKHGGEIKILSLKTEEKKATIQLEFEPPPNTIPATPHIGLPAMGAPKAAGKGAAAPGVQIIPGVGPVAGTLLGLTVQDDKGNTLPLEISTRVFRQFRVQQLPGGGNVAVPAAVWTLVCQPGKNQGQPAKIVYLGRKQVTVEVPFALKDVPLP